ncbi:SLAIN motif-containing protein 2-like isoform X5 [Eriocheir sinensis]|uniref:SLAIN motif-containing protein 2-like isoform X5 n=1 Tax=Eriocheir sinensis TaxID=95602 RepID=UPI0021C71499|nr:SLAIN motif-containing protein 2-like isoform X5 [Eriocheir sinensis]
MSLIMDNRLESTATEAEVKKLQALVKELELQNEELRTERQQLMKEGGSSTPHSLPSAPATPKKQPSENLDAMAPLGLEEESLSDEETWLFDSPSTKSHTTDWLRKDIDDPSLQQSKRSLINKLDQIAMSPHQSPRHSFSPCSSSGVLSPESPPSSRDGSSREYLARSSGSLGSEEDDRLSSASEGSFSYQLTDVADVNALARLQEESLKLPDPRRTSRLPGIRGGPNTTTMNHPYSSAGSGGSITSSQEDLIANPNPTGSPRRPPRGLQAPTRYSAHTNASREGSDLSTPPDSPYNSQHNLEYCNGRGGGGNMRHSGGGLHRGLGGSDPRLLDHHHLPIHQQQHQQQSVSTPGSSRGASPARSHNSPSASQTDLRYPARTSKLQAPQMRSRLSAPSPVRVPASGASGLPQPTDIPRPKSSGIPRPGSRLQAPRARSGLVAPRFQATPQEDWRDGCF